MGMRLKHLNNIITTRSQFHLNCVFYHIVVIVIVAAVLLCSRRRYERGNQFIGRQFRKSGLECGDVPLRSIEAVWISLPLCDSRRRRDQAVEILFQVRVARRVSHCAVGRVVGVEAMAQFLGVGDAVAVGVPIGWAVFFRIRIPAADVFLRVDEVPLATRMSPISRSSGRSCISEQPE